MKNCIVLLLMVFLLAGCNSSNNQISNDELNFFANKLVDDIKESPSSAFEEKIDSDFLFERMYDGSFDFSLLDYQIKSGFRKGLKGFHEAMGYEITNGSYELIKIEIREDGGHLFFRLFSDDGLNIHDFLVVRKNERLVIADVYIYTAGEYFSKLLAVAYSYMLTSSNILNKEFSEERLQEVKNIGKVRKLLEGGEYEKAFALMKDVDDQFKKEKFWHILNIQCAAGLDSATYIGAMEDFGNEFPKDPSWFLMGVDYFFLLGNYEKAIMSLDELGEFLGKDPVIELLKANMYWANKDFENSYKIIMDNLKEVQNLSDFYFTKASCEGNLRMYDSLESTLRTMNDRFEIEIIELDYTGFENFQETDAFARLMKEQGYEFE
jgi:tetratricopeptide (TPR) repeat protein